MFANDGDLKVLKSLYIHSKKTSLNNMQSAYLLQTVRYNFLNKFPLLKFP